MPLSLSLLHELYFRGLHVSKTRKELMSLVEPTEVFLPVFSPTNFGEKETKAIVLVLK